jgi:hypothetical protein
VRMAGEGVLREEVLREEVVASTVVCGVGPTCLWLCRRR